MCIRDRKHGIDAAKLMLRLRLAFVNRTYYTLTPRSGHNKPARAAVLAGSMFSRPCAPEMCIRDRMSSTMRLMFVKMLRPET